MYAYIFYISFYFVPVVFAFHIYDLIHNIARRVILTFQIMMRKMRFMSRSYMWSMLRIMMQAHCLSTLPSGQHAAEKEGPL